MSAPRPCAYCGNPQYLVLPNMVQELKREQMVMGFKAYETLQTYWHFSLVICTGCTRTEVFTTNGQELQHNVPGANLVAAASQ